MRKYFTIAFIFLCSQANTQNIIDLNPISITTTRAAQKISETGRSISIIDGKTISKLPIHSLDELLKYSASVEVQQRGPDGAQADIVIRGGTFQQVLVLLDGVKINDPITGHFNAYMPIATSQIERIEILKGPAAAAYGSEAVGGVINIISKTFASFKKEKSIQRNASITTGEYGYLAAAAGIYKTGNKINYSIAANTNNANGQLLRSSNRGYFHTNTFSANAGIPLQHNWTLFLQSSYDSRNFAAQNFYTSFTSDTATEKVNTFFNHLKLKQSTATTTNEIDASYKNSSDHYEYNKTAQANNNKSGAFSVQYLHTKKSTLHFTYNYGISGEYKTITSNDRGNHSNQNAAIFGTAIYKIKQLSINPGLRLVSDKNFGTEILPQANLSYKINNLILKANAGRALHSNRFRNLFLLAQLLLQ
jgi:iron complex outermembrane receptor protein